MSTVSIDEDIEGVPLPAVTLLDGPIRVKRSISVQQAGMVVTLGIQRRRPISVEQVVVDSLPRHFEIDAIGFHPDHEPAVGTVDKQEATVSAIATAEGAISVRYGICPSRPQRPETVSELQDSARLSVKVAETLEANAQPISETQPEAKDRSNLTVDGGPARAAMRLKSLLERD